MTAVEDHPGMSKAEALRLLVAEMDGENLPVVEIARRCGCSKERVEQILDYLDAHPEPVVPAAVTAPDVSKSIEQVGEALAAGETATATAEPPALRESVSREHGSRKGYQQHYGHGEKPCDSCKDAWNTSEKAKRAARREARPAEVKRVDDKLTELKAAAPRVVPITTTSSAATPTVIRQHIQVRWLVPRGEDLPTGTHIEFGVKAAGGMRTVTEATAEVSAGHGVTVFRRLVTDWVEVTDP